MALVLLVTDDPVRYRVSGWALEQDGHEVSFAVPTSAIRAVAESQPDVIVELIQRQLKISPDAEIDESNFPKLSREDHDAVARERQRVTEAERRMGKLLLDKLGIISDEEPSIQRIPLQGSSGSGAAEAMRTFEIIYCGCCDPCGVYVDPPGICSPI